MVAGGVGPRAVRDARRSARRAQDAGDAVLRRPTAPTSCIYLDLFRRPRRRSRADDRGRQPAATAAASPRRSSARCARARSAAGQAVRLRPDADDAAPRAARRRARPRLRGLGGTDHGLRPRRLLQLRVPMRADGGTSHHMRTCIERPVLRRARRDRVGGAWQTLTMDLSVHIGSLRLKNPLIAASGCFGYGVEYADVVDLAVARRRRGQGAVPRRARRASAAAHRRNAVGHAQRDRPAGHRRAPLHRRKAAGAARAARHRHRQHLRHDARRIRRARADPLGRRRRRTRSS